MSHNITITKFKNLVKKNKKTNKLVIKDYGLKFAILRNNVGFYDMQNISITKESNAFILGLSNDKIREYLNNLRLNGKADKENKEVIKKTKSFSDTFFEVVKNEINARNLAHNSKRNYFKTLNKLQAMIQTQKNQRDFESKLYEVCLDSSIQSALNFVVTLIKAYNDNAESNKMLNNNIVNRICKIKTKYRKDNDKKVSSFTLDKEDLLTYFDLARQCFNRWFNLYNNIKTNKDKHDYEHFIALSKHLYLVFACCRNSEVWNLTFDCFKNNFREVINPNNKTKCAETIAVSFISRFIILRVKEIKYLLISTENNIEKDFVFTPFTLSNQQKKALITRNSNVSSYLESKIKHYTTPFKQYKATKNTKQNDNHIVRTYFGGLCSNFVGVGNCYDFALLHNDSSYLATYKGNAGNNIFLIQSFKAFMFRDIAFLCCLNKTGNGFNLLTTEFRDLLNDTSYKEIAVDTLMELSNAFKYNSLDKRKFIDYFNSGFVVDNGRFVMFEIIDNTKLLSFYNVEIIDNNTNKRFWGLDLQTQDISDLEVDSDMLSF